MAEADVDRPRALRKKPQSVAAASEKLVERTNALSASDFFARFAPFTPLSTLLDGHQGLERIQGDAANVPAQWLEQCLRLIEQTSAVDYQKSEIQWSPSKKRKEMKLPDMKYIILAQQHERLAGFISFMITYEDGFEVLYVYEIHFTVEWRGNGLGQRMINIVEGIAQAVGVAKVMLTVFKANPAVSWYAKLGYQEDDFSPGPRRLRNGTVKEPSIIILSKTMKG